MVEAGLGHAGDTWVPIDDLVRYSLPGAIAQEAAGMNVHFSYPKVGQNTSWAKWAKWALREGWSCGLSCALC